MIANHFRSIAPLTLGIFPRTGRKLPFNGNFFAFAHIGLYQLGGFTPGDHLMPLRVGLALSFVVPVTFVSGQLKFGQFSS